MEGVNNMFTFEIGYILGMAVVVAVLLAWADYKPQHGTHKNKKGI